MFGSSSIEFVAAPDPVQLVCTNDDGKDTELTLLDVAKASAVPCRLNPLLFNGHLQTLWIMSGQHTDIPIHYKRWDFQSGSAFYPGQFAVDFMVHPTAAAAIPPRNKSLPNRTHAFTEEEFAAYASNTEADQKPLLIVLHGLSGGSHEQYLRHALKGITSDDVGFDACVVNARGCAWSTITTPFLFNARATWDLRQFVHWAKDKWPDRKLYGMGFSLGANILCNYLGEEGDACELNAAVLVGNPWNLDVANSLLENSWIGLHVYLAGMGSGLRRLFARHLDIMTTNKGIDAEKVQNSKYLFEWDRLVQCPTWGYPTEHAYYRDASSADTLLNIRIPVLALHARNDPICGDLAVPWENLKQNPYVVMCATSHGGHLGWFEFGGGRWYTTVACNFLRTMLHDMKRVRPADPQPIVDINNVPSFNPMRRRLHVGDSMRL